MIISNKYSVYYSGVAVGERAEEELRIMIKEEMDTRVTKLKPISSRIMYNRLEMEEKLHII